MAPDRDPPAVNPVYEWSFALEQVVSESGRVDYDRLAEQRDVLEAYVAWLSQVETPQADHNRTALWLNARSAFALYAALEVQPLPCLRDLPASGPWLGDPFTTQLQFELGRDRLSLSQIEHSYLRYRIQDPRLFAALAEGRYSGPPVRPGMYMPHSIDEELDQMNRWWLNDAERGVQLVDGVAVFPAELVAAADDIFRWTPGQDLCTFASQYVAEPLASDLSALSQAGCPHRSAVVDERLNHETRPDRVRHPL